MDLNEYQQQAIRTRNKNVPTLEGDKAELMNYLIGLAGEVGEFLNLVKKYVFHGYPITQERLVDELGDILWYLIVIMFMFGVDPTVVIEYNINKLKTRYPEGFKLLQDRKE